MASTTGYFTISNSCKQTVSISLGPVKQTGEYCKITKTSGASSIASNSSSNYTFTMTCPSSYYDGAQVTYSGRKTYTANCHAGGTTCEVDCTKIGDTTDPTPGGGGTGGDTGGGSTSCGTYGTLADCGPHEALDGNGGTCDSTYRAYFKGCQENGEWTSCSYNKQNCSKDSTSYIVYFNDNISSGTTS